MESLPPEEWPQLMQPSAHARTHAMELCYYILDHLHPTSHQSSSIMVEYKKSVLYRVNLVRENHFPTQLFKIFKMNEYCSTLIKNYGSEQLIF